MRNARRSKQQLTRTSANRARVFEFMERFSARHLYTIDGPSGHDLDEIMAFAYEGGVAVIHTFEGVHGIWTLYTEPSVSGDLDELEAAMRLQIAERAEPGRPNPAYLASLRIPVEGMTPDGFAAVDTCPYCKAGAAFSKELPAYHVTEFFEGHERDHILCIGKLASNAQPNYTLRRALQRIEEMSVPDQPASSEIDEHVWIMRHVARLRKIAQEALLES